MRTQQLKSLNLGKLAALLLAIGAPGAASAMEWGTSGAATVDLYAVPRLATSSSGAAAPAGDPTTYFDGLGLKSTFKVYDWLGVLVEYQNLHATETVQGPTATEPGGTVTDWRLGPGYVLPSGTGGFVEYVSRETRGVSADGFGVRGRLAGQVFKDVHGFAELAYAGLKIDGAGSEKTYNLALGAVYTITGAWGLYTEYKRTQFSNNDFDLETAADEFRLGIRARLDY